MDPWQFLSVEESVATNPNISESSQKTVDNIVSRHWKPANATAPVMSTSVHYNINQFLSANIMTGNYNILKRNEPSYSLGKKEDSSYFSQSIQQQQQPQEKFACPLGCGSVYSQNKNLQYHMKYECGKEPRFKCPYCSHRTKRKNNLMLHISSQHSETLKAPLTS
jgi:hypothetical protein